MYKRYRLESILIAASLIGFLIIFSSFVDWWHGGYFGFRHILSIYPFLMLPLAYCLESKDKKVWALILFFAGISIFHNFIGLTGSYSDVLRVEGVLEEKYVDDIKKGTIFENPLYDLYLPLFIRDGPRSKIFENLINGNIDINIKSESVSEKIKQITYNFYVPFLCLLPISIIFIIIWKDEIFDVWSSLSQRSKKIIYFLIIILIGLAFTKIPIHNEEIYLGKGWYLKSPIEVGRWLYENGTIIINNEKKSEENTALSLTLSSYYKDRNASIYFNDKKIDSFIVRRNYEFHYYWFLSLKPGTNTVKLTSAGCDYPYKIEEGRDDERCLGVYMEEFALNKTIEDLALGQDWYSVAGNDDVNWMYKNGTVVIFNTESNPKNAIVNFTLRSFNITRTVDIYLNSKLIKTSQVTTSDTQFSLVLEFKPKENHLIFVAKEACTIMGTVIGNDDTRCVTLGIKGLNFRYF